MIYLIFNEGYAASAGATLVRRDLCSEAIRLAKLLCVLMPDEPEAFGLLALMLLQDSRRDARAVGRTASSCCSPTRIGASGTRARSTRACGCSSARRRSGGRAVPAAGGDRGRPRARGRTRRRSSAAYEALLRLDGSPVARLNHAVAVALAGDVERGLALIDAIQGLDELPPLPLRPRRPAAPARPLGEARDAYRAGARAHRGRARAAVPRAPARRDRRRSATMTPCASPPRSTTPSGPSIELAAAAPGAGQGRAPGGGPVDPAQVPREHPRRPAKRRPRREPARRRRRLPPRPASGRDHRRRRDPGRRRADRERPRRAAGRDRLRRGRRCRCGTSGSSCGRRCAACSSRRRSPTSSSAAARRRPRAAQAKTRSSSARTQTICPRASSSSAISSRGSSAPSAALAVARRRARRRRLEAEVGDALDHRLDRVRAADRARSRGRVGAPSESPSCVRLADEPHHELGARLARRASRGAPTCSTRAWFITAIWLDDLHRLRLVVRDEDRRHVHLLVEAAQPVAQLGAHAGVERAERLVEKEHLRLRSRARARAPCAGAGRPRAATGSGAPNASSWTSFRSSSTRSRISAFGPLAHLEPERDVVAHGHVLEGRVVLEDEADVALLRRAAPWRPRPRSRSRPRPASRARR